MAEEDVSEDDNKSEPAEDFNATKGAVELAYDNKVNINLIEGSGKDGRVLKSDVQNHIDIVQSNIEQKNWNGHTKYVYKSNGRIFEHLDKQKVIEVVESDILEREENDEED